MYRSWKFQYLETWALYRSWISNFEVGLLKPNISDGWWIVSARDIRRMDLVYFTLGINPRVINA
jgi:hypothetical protein